MVEVDERLRDALRDATDRIRERERALGRRDEDRPRRAASGADARWWRTCPTESRRGCCCGRSRSCRAWTRWVAMVQREVGERLAAAPGSGAYGVPSVIAQLACEVRGRCGRSRGRFFIRSRTLTPCSSACAGTRRRAAGASPLRERSWAVRSRTGARRSPGSLTLSGRAGGRSRERIRGALERLGHPADARAERLSPRTSGRWRGRWSYERAQPADLPARALAPAKINLGLFVGPTRAKTAGTSWSR